ncbi:ABC transporter [Altererythrobacter aerius]|uniref:ABC transporter n=1 Tax=Tsuneonella aeria TaxID=1837929 RepID=A0A6I4TC17_9SPHN|nr:ABC transporter [Tsuneonella aeria]MXO74593.1 ABC transporter [Tsuneonella aeria]
MARVKRRAATLAAAAAGLALAGAAGWALADRAEPRAPLGLFSSLPVVWPETASLGELIAPDAAPHWVRTALEDRFTPVPLDALDAQVLAPLRSLVMAQPRPLAPAENVALDEWVRAGGRVLLFADPLLTEESRFAIGDRRRPQDVVLLSPILSRWGLELTFDEDQDGRERLVAVGGQAVPVRLAGALRPVAGPGSECAIESAGLIAECQVGKGRVVVFADAAVLESARGVDGGGHAFEALLLRAFP